MDLSLFQQRSCSTVWIWVCFFFFFFLLASAWQNRNYFICAAITKVRCEDQGLNTKGLGHRTGHRNDFMLRKVVNLTSVSTAAVYLLTRSSPPLRAVTAEAVKSLLYYVLALPRAVLFYSGRGDPCISVENLPSCFIPESPYRHTIELIIFLLTESKPASQGKVFHGKNLKCPHETIKCDPRAHKSLNYSVCSSQLALFWGLIFLVPLENNFLENQKLNNFRKAWF